MNLSFADGHCNRLPIWVTAHASREAAMLSAKRLLRDTANQGALVVIHAPRVRVGGSVSLVFFVVVTVEREGGAS